MKKHSDGTLSTTRSPQRRLRAIGGNGQIAPAVSDFLGARSLDPDILPIDGIGVYFQKTA